MINKYLYSFFWTLGFLVILDQTNKLLDYFVTKYQATFNFTYNLWWWGTFPIIVGIYLSLYRGIPRHFKVNSSQLIIFVLSFLITIYPFILYYFHAPIIKFIIPRLFKYDSQIIIGLLCGFSLINSFFSFDKKTS